MVTRLAPPPAPGADFSWVKPGKVVWDYWAELEPGGRRLRGGAERRDLPLPRRLRRAERLSLREHRLDVVGPLRPVRDEPGGRRPGARRVRPREGRRDLRLVPDAARSSASSQPALDRFQKWGVAGLKIDFFDRDDQRMIEPLPPVRRRGGEAQAARALPRRDAADGASRASCRTSSATRRCAASSTTSSTAGHAAAATRSRFPTRACSPGPMDYTPGAMRALEPGELEGRRTTSPRARARSPTSSRCTSMYDAPAGRCCPTCRRRTSASREALELLKAVPTTWDETVGLDGRIGEWVLARAAEGRRVVGRRR